MSSLALVAVLAVGGITVSLWRHRLRLRRLRRPAVVLSSESVVHNLRGEQR